MKLKELFKILTDYEYIKIVYNNEVVYYGISGNRFGITNYDILKDKKIENIALDNNVKDAFTHIFFKPYMWIYLEK